MNKEIPKSFTIKTKNLWLRMTSVDDVERIYSATEYAGFNDGMTWEPPENNKEIIDSIKRNHKAWEIGEGYAFSIFKDGDTQLIGRISIRKTKLPKVLNVGFWTHPEAQKKGIMTEALAGILNFGFEQLNAIRIEASHAIWNKGSEKVLKRNGMEFQKKIEEGFKKKGKWVAENLLSLSKENWKK